MLKGHVEAFILYLNFCTDPLAVGLHIAAFEGTAERVSVEFLKQSAATAKQDVVSTPAFITQLLQNLPKTPHTITDIYIIRFYYKAQ